MGNDSDHLAEGDVVATRPVSFHHLELLIIDLVGRSLGQRLEAAEQVRNHVEREVLRAEFLQFDDRQL